MATYSFRLPSACTIKELQTHIRHLSAQCKREGESLNGALICVGKDPLNGGDPYLYVEYSLKVK